MSNKEIKIKEYDLHVIVRDLIDSALEIDRPNKEKICKFIVNLVQNGGHRTEAALAAGYGPVRNKDGKKLSDAERRKVAGNEGSRLLENEGIFALYEKLLSHRFTAEIFTKSFSKEHMVSVLYQIGMNTYEQNPRQAVMALKEAATLAGFYETDQADDPKDKAEKIEELIKSGDVVSAFRHAQTKTNGEYGEGQIEEAVRLKSEVYN